MVCVYCGNSTQVVNSRLQKRHNKVWRRRKCQTCKGVFTSVETPQLDSSVVVESSTGHFEPFSREKLYLDVYMACKHRKTAITDASGLTDTIITRLCSALPEATVTRARIVEQAAATLQRFDKAAGVQYLAYHPLSEKYKV